MSIMPLYLSQKHISGYNQGFSAGDVEHVKKYKTKTFHNVCQYPQVVYHVDEGGEENNDRKNLKEVEHNTDPITLNAKKCSGKFSPNTKEAPKSALFKNWVIMLLIQDMAWNPHGNFNRNTVVMAGSEKKPQETRMYLETKDQWRWHATLCLTCFLSSWDGVKNTKRTRHCPAYEQHAK